MDFVCKLRALLQPLGTAASTYRFGIAEIDFADIKGSFAARFNRIIRNIIGFLTSMLRERPLDLRYNSSSCNACLAYGFEYVFERGILSHGTNGLHNMNFEADIFRFLYEVVDPRLDSKSQFVHFFCNFIGKIRCSHRATLVSEHAAVLISNIHFYLPIGKNVLQIVHILFFVLEILVIRLLAFRKPV